MNKQKSIRGFTLVEIMIATGVSLIIVGIIVEVLMTSQRSFSTGVGLMRVHSNARLAMDQLTRDVKWARQIATSVTIGGTTYTTGDNELVLEVPSLDASGEILAVTFDTIVYHLTGASPDQIERIVSPDGASSRLSEEKIVANEVTAFDLSSGGVGLSSIANLQSVNDISITVTTSITVIGDQSVQETLSSRAKLRNFD